MNLVFDSETSGLPLWREPSTHPGQPHLVQLALVMVDDDHVEHSAVSVIIKPDGWVISDEVAKIHGITHEIAMERGIPEADAVDMFVEHYTRSGRLIAHNIAFDRRIMRIALLRRGWARDLIEEMEKGPAVCTMRLADPIIKLPPTDKMRAAGFNKTKAPNLGECIEFFHGEKLEGAHDALVDARACARVYQAIMARAAVPMEAA